MESTIIARLQDVGLSLYEARVYVALLVGGPQNGNAVANLAHVPSSKVYPALNKMAKEGVVSSFQRGTSTLFTATPPEELIDRLRRRYKTPLDFLADELPKIEELQPTQPFLTISGATAMIEAARSIIEAAKVELYISCWNEDLPPLFNSLTTAADNGVSIHGMLYGEAELPPGDWQLHHYEDIVAERVGGRLIALVADGEEALMARIPHSGDISAVRSRNPVMALVVREYLHHDNILQRAQRAIGFDQWDSWWQADPDARAEILGRALSSSRPESSSAT